jgi:hypothetical protein
MKSLGLCLAALIICAAPALAQETEEPPAIAQEAEETSDIDWSRIQFDALSLMRELPSSAPAPRAAQGDATTWNRTENKNGSANVALKRSWAPGVATNVGVDSVGSPQGWSPPGAPLPPSSGAGWASAAIPGVGLIDQTVLDARLDPDADQRKFGARVSKSIPLNEGLSVTVQNGYGVSQPLVTGPAGAAAPAHVIDSEQLAKLNFLPLGTSVFAGSKTSSIDDRRLNSLGAEQNLLGGISLSGTVSDNAAGGHDRSLTARFKRSW